MAVKLHKKAEANETPRRRAAGYLKGIIFIY